MNRGRVHSLYFVSEFTIKPLPFPSPSIHQPAIQASASSHLPSRLQLFSYSNFCLLQLKLLSNMRFSVTATAIFGLVAATPSAANQWTNQLTKDLQGLALSTRSIWGPAGTITRVDGPLFADNLGNFPVSFQVVVCIEQFFIRIYRKSSVD